MIAFACVSLILIVAVKRVVGNLVGGVRCRAARAQVARPRQEPQQRVLSDVMISMTWESEGPRSSLSPSDVV